jgi:hypothetical protein
MAAIDKSAYTTSATNDSDTTAKDAAVKLRVVLLKLQSNWSGDGKEAAIRAAMEFGKLVASRTLDSEITAEELRKLFVAKKVDEEYWQDVIRTFEAVGSLPLPEGYSIRECFPAHANDNDEPEDQKLTSDVTLSDITNPGGVVSDIVDWIVSSSSRPSRELALSSTLPFVGALIGRRFASPTDLRTNFYVVALAGSGFGKDHARTQLKRLVTEAGLGRFTGPNRFMSATGLRVAVMTKPSCFCMVDEFGGMMRQINDERAGIHSQLIRSDLLEMFSSAATFFEGSAYAGTSPEKIQNPNLCIYGTSTPEDFWASVSSRNAVDGLLPRFLLFNVTGPKPARVVPSRTVYDVPETLIQAVQALALAGRGTGNLANTDHGGTASKPAIVRYSAEAETELARFEASIEEREALAPSGSLSILNRAVEHAIKLALTVSVATDSQNPVISGDAMKWAVQLAWLSTCTMIEETRDRISDSHREADLQRILGQIKKAGKEGITEGQIADRCRGIDRKRRDELLADLVLTGLVEMRETPSKGRPKKRYYLA